MIEATQVQKKEVPAEEAVERSRSGRRFVPEVDIYETGDEIVLLADMPGVAEKEVDVTLENNVLTIEGIGQVPTPEGQRLVRAEFGLGTYGRSFTVTDEIDRSRIEARIRNGVLKLVLPKTAPAKARKIQVKTE